MPNTIQWTRYRLHIQTLHTMYLWQAGISTGATVNECLVSNGGCAQICSDAEDGFSCSCNVGYVLAGNGLDCNGEL